MKSPWSGLIVSTPGNNEPKYLVEELLTSLKLSHVKLAHATDGILLAAVFRPKEKSISPKCDFRVVWSRREISPGASTVWALWTMPYDIEEQWNWMTIYSHLDCVSVVTGSYPNWARLMSFLSTIHVSDQDASPFRTFSDCICYIVKLHVWLPEL